MTRKSTTSRRAQERKANELLRKAFREQLEIQFKNGVAQGAYAISRVVLEKAMDKTRTTEQRLADVADFCTACTVIRANPSAAQTVNKQDGV